MALMFHINAMHMILMVKWSNLMLGRWPGNILKFMTLFIEILCLSWSRSTQFNSSL